MGKVSDNWQACLAIAVQCAVGIYFINQNASLRKERDYFLAELREVNSFVLGGNYSEDFPASKPEAEKGKGERLPIFEGERGAKVRGVHNKFNVYRGKKPTEKFVLKFIDHFWSAPWVYVVEYSSGPDNMGFVPRCEVRKESLTVFTRSNCRVALRGSEVEERQNASDASANRLPVSMGSTTFRRLQ